MYGGCLLCPLYPLLVYLGITLSIFGRILGIFGYFGEFFSGILVYHYPPPPPWPTLTKVIASFYWHDSETVFLVFLRSTSQCFTCQLFLSQMREIFTLSWPIFPETSRRLPKISDELPKTSERCRKLNVRRCSRRLLSDFVRTQKRTQSHNVLRIICSDLWVRREKLSLIRDIDVFSPQA